MVIRSGPTLMFEIPLFPLNTVLFPGMPLSLHIFEERYKQMINYCIDERQPFGVVLIQEGQEVGGEAVPHNIGCTAQITRVQSLAQGRMNIVAVGHERFRIIAMKADKPYLVGVAERLPLLSVSPMTDVTRLRRLVVRYLHILKEIGQIQIDTQQLPDDALTMAYLSAVLLQTPSTQKQALLAADDLDQMIAALCETYQREVVLLKAMSDYDENTNKQGPFSLN
jgi:uncharacterized protein